MKFIGNKLRLLNYIDTAVEQTGIKEGTFIDLFTGTTNVAQYYKRRGFKIISNDMLSFSYAFQHAYIKVNQMPSFRNLELGGQRRSVQKTLNGARVSEVISYLNNLEGIKGFIYENYCDRGTENKKYKRRYFSDSNAKKIDAIRTQIQKWYGEGSINEDEFYVLLAELVDSSDFIANNSGTYGAFLKIWRSMALKPLHLDIPKIVSSKIEHEINQKDAKGLIKGIEGDILYLDPPYNSRQYAPNYHILETITLYDNPEIYGKTGIREGYFKSKLSMKSKASKEFETIVRNAKVKYILMNYNNEGIIPYEVIKACFEEKGEFSEIRRNYKRYRSESNHEKRCYKDVGDQTTEYLYTCKVN